MTAAATACRAGWAGSCPFSLITSSQTRRIFRISGTTLTDVALAQTSRGRSSCAEVAVAGDVGIVGLSLSGSATKAWSSGVGGHMLDRPAEHVWYRTIQRRPPSV
jgi:hypothetical protein